MLQLHKVHAIMMSTELSCLGVDPQNLPRVELNQGAVRLDAVLGVTPDLFTEQTWVGHYTKHAGPALCVYE